MSSKNEIRDIIEAVEKIIRKSYPESEIISIEIDEEKAHGIVSIIDLHHISIRFEINENGIDMENKQEYFDSIENDQLKWWDRLVVDERFYNPLVPVIYWFSGEYRFLSNFYPTQSPSHSVEHHYQAAKVKEGKELDFIREQIINASSAGQAKKLGGKVDLRENWESIKEEIMRKLLAEKFYLNEDLKKQLIQTGNAYLIEGTLWHDNFYGICIKKNCERCSKIKGLNRLGVMLMELREIIKG